MSITAFRRLHREVEAFANYISPSPLEHEVRSKIVQHITDSIRKAIPDAIVLPFGSFETKLYLPGGYVCIEFRREFC